MWLENSKLLVNPSDTSKIDEMIADNNDIRNHDTVCHFVTDSDDSQYHSVVKTISVVQLNLGCK